MIDVQLFIDGRWQRGARALSMDVCDPATELVCGRVAVADSTDIERALEAAFTAFPGWRAARPTDRGGVLRRTAAILAERIESAALALTTEQGKPLAESRAEIRRAIDTFAWHAEEAERIDTAVRVRERGPSHSTVSEPIGVVGAFTPWNYPAVIIARKLGAALAAGCTVVLKAAEETPSIAAAMVAALESAGVPPGVVNLVFGDPAAISAQVLESELVRAFSFTGSTAVGKRLAAQAGERLLRSVFELGGHAPVLVLEDADLTSAIDQIVAYKFECAGQSCNAPSRIYVHASRYAEFVHAFVRSAERLRVGDGRDPSTGMGPLANTRRMDAMQRLTDDARSRGAQVRTGGERFRRSGFFWPPTVLTDVPEQAGIVSEEPFGPIVPIWPFTTVDEAIARANATAYGLAGYIFTASSDSAVTVARALTVGSVGINSLAGVPPDVGIAGVKDSGFGYEGGRLGVEAFLNLKVIRWPPDDITNQRRAPSSGDAHG
jgi:succinate-semialdehyde dehydrogenase / glutarate-semialdehyde dehydrogenase